MEGSEESLAGTEADLINCGLLIEIILPSDQPETQIEVYCDKPFGHTDDAHSGS